MKICLLGASFDTSNCGVSALAAASVKCLTQKFDDAEIVLLNYGKANGCCSVKLKDGSVDIKLMNMDISKRVWTKNHILRLILTAWFLKLLPVRSLKSTIINRNEYLRTIAGSGFVAAISGGDSFSDIYGMRRLIYVTLGQYLAVLVGARLVLLPQTYGPFSSLASRTIAKYFFKHALRIYSRDHEGIAEVQKIAGAGRLQDKSCFCPDVAFVLDSYEPDASDIDQLSQAGDDGAVVVGFNVSGLLFNGNRNYRNVDKLKVDYKCLVYRIIELLMDNQKVVVLLVPHVLDQAGCIESDVAACRSVYEELREKYQNRIFITAGSRNPCETKHTIGLCDFFLASRMHASIAAITQNIPSVGLAYSDKFRGVFRSVGLADYTIDLRRQGESEVVSLVAKAFVDRKRISKELSLKVCQAKESVLKIFDDISKAIDGVREKN